MAYTGQIGLSGLLKDVGGNSSQVNVGPPAKTFSSSSASRRDVALTSGNNTITLPTNCTALLIRPPVGNTVTLTLKGASGDTGIPLSLTGWQVLDLGVSPTVIINASGSVTLDITFL